ncbi:DUF3231 family protein [Gracilibacillus alcaliphilus]|uniref:DUF3231 family protein n=1 Tax=Gracilibacillus alcaliphilus TaxID=1401441 RepID=UPI00195A8AF4|nr:DUF3231 family protein [Gracilibacillus alcaliphilus]MBM7677805.1 hypothetical protein [Gracilibacillus alcaliphilus]
MEKTFSASSAGNYLSDGTLLMTSEVIDSMESFFSDKLMIDLITVLIASKEYIFSLPPNPKRDLAAPYTRLSAETINFTDNGINSILDSNWMEQPSEAVNQKELSK